MLPAAILQACVELLKPTGGKIHAFMASLPNCGTRSLKLRDGNINVSDKEKQMELLPQDLTYMTLASQAADFNVRARNMDGRVSCRGATTVVLCTAEPANYVYLLCCRVCH